MKFNKLLKSGIGSGETTASLYLRFGELKKQLKIMSQAMNQDTDGVLLVSELSNSAPCMLRPDDSCRHATALDRSDHDGAHLQDPRQLRLRSKRSWQPLRTSCELAAAATSQNWQVNAMRFSIGLQHTLIGCQADAVLSCDQEAARRDLTTEEAAFVAMLNEVSAAIQVQSTVLPGSHGQSDVTRQLHHVSYKVAVCDKLR
jgi:hypothetical protein